MKSSLCLATLAAAVSSAPVAQAIIVHDANGLTAAPADGQGWQFVGQWGNGVGSGVAIAPNWLITAQHFTNASNQFHLNGVTYTRDQPLVDIPNTDLRLVHVSGTFPAYAPLFRKNDASETGKSASLVGFGLHQHAVNPDVTTGAIQNGWFWAGDSVTRARGRNIVNAVATVGGLRVMMYDFDPVGAPSAVPDEAGLADHDSGGGAFVFDDGEWKLAGVHLGLDAYYRNASDTDFLQASIFDGAGLYRGSMVPRPAAPGGPGNSYSSRVAPYLAQIDAATGGTAASTRYWDINGATTGAGGSAPAGTWNGSTVNFNTNPTGGAGALSANPPSVDTIVFAAGTDATGAYTVNLTGTRTAAKIKFTTGQVTLAGGTLASSAFEVSGGATGTITSTIANPSSSLAKSGAGVLELTTLPLNYAVNIADGTLRVKESSPGLSTGHPSGNNASVSRPASLSIAPGATLDLMNNDLILDYTTASPAPALEDLIASGNIVSGITSLDESYVLGIADNALLAEPFDTFSGVDVDDTTVLIKFTHRADFNLDGRVTFSDASIFGTNFQDGQPATWATGDIDYDGVYTFSDAAIFGTYYSETLQSLPEPGALSLLSVGAMVLARRRR